MKKVFIDGSQGTTGLKIYKRFECRDDIHLLHIDEDKRKDAKERARLINSSDITFLCLPDEASIEAVSLVENDSVISTGSTLINAFDRLEVAEVTANTIIHAKAIGDIVTITDKEVEDINKALHLK